MKIRTDEILAFYYNDRKLKQGQYLLHSYEVGEHKTFCGIDIEHLAGYPDNWNKLPTCKKCLSKYNSITK